MPKQKLDRDLWLLGPPIPWWRIQRARSRNRIRLWKIRLTRRRCQWCGVRFIPYEEHKPGCKTWEGFYR